MSNNPKVLSIDLLPDMNIIQFRECLDDAAIAEYAEVYTTDPSRMPPIDALFDGKEYWAWNGAHRICAARKAGKASLMVKVESGSRREAMRLALGANQDHGVRRTPGDKRKAIGAALADKEWLGLGDEQIAEMTGTHAKLVASVRKETGATSITRVGRDGKTYRVPQKPKKPKSKSGSEISEPGNLGTTESDEKLSEVSAQTTDSPAPAKPSFAERVAAHNLEVERAARAVRKGFEEATKFRSAWMDDAVVNVANQQIDSACGVIRCAKVHDKPCPRCDGDGVSIEKPCSWCRGSGMLPKRDYEMAGGS